MNTFKLIRMQKNSVQVQNGVYLYIFIYYSGWRLYRNNEDDILLIIFINFLNDKIT